MRNVAFTLVCLAALPCSADWGTQFVTAVPFVTKTTAGTPAVYLTCVSNGDSQVTVTSPSFSAPIVMVLVAPFDSDMVRVTPDVGDIVIPYSDNDRASADQVITIAATTPVSCHWYGSDGGANQSFWEIRSVAGGWDHFILNTAGDAGDPDTSAFELLINQENRRVSITGTGGRGEPLNFSLGPFQALMHMRGDEWDETGAELIADGMITVVAGDGLHTTAGDFCCADAVVSAQEPVVSLGRKAYATPFAVGAGSVTGYYLTKVVSLTDGTITHTWVSPTSPIVGPTAVPLTARVPVVIEAPGSDYSGVIEGDVPISVTQITRSGVANGWYGDPSLSSWPAANTLASAGDTCVVPAMHADLVSLYRSWQTWRVTVVSACNDVSVTTGSATITVTAWAALHDNTLYAQLDLDPTQTHRVRSACGGLFCRLEMLGDRLAPGALASGAVELLPSITGCTPTPSPLNNDLYSVKESGSVALWVTDVLPPGCTFYHSRRAVGDKTLLPLGGSFDFSVTDTPLANTVIGGISYNKIALDATSPTETLVFYQAIRE